MRLKVRNFYESDDQDTKEFLRSVNRAIYNVNDLNNELERFDKKLLNKIGLRVDVYVEDVNKKKVNVKKVKDGDIDIIKGNIVFDIIANHKTVFEQILPINGKYIQYNPAIFNQSGSALIHAIEQIVSFVKYSNLESKQIESADGIVPDEAIPDEYK